MSRIGKLPIQIPIGITVTIQGNTLHMKGTLGEQSIQIDPSLKVVLENDIITVSKKNTNDMKAKTLHGLYRTLISNAINGVNTGFEKKLEINGVGFKVSLSGNKLIFAVGFTHNVEVIAPKNITFKIDEQKKNLITIKGINKQEVGQIAANLRAIRPPEPYKGKGIKYLNEFIRRKAGKTATKGS